MNPAFTEWASHDPLKHGIFVAAEIMVLGGLAALGLLAVVRLAMWLMR